MNRLRALLTRLGLPEVARRAGVTELTVRRWARGGISASAREVVRGIFDRHEHSRRSAATHKKRVRVKKGQQTRAKRDRFQEDIAEAAKVPASDAPREPPRTRKVRDYQAPGKTLPIDTFRYEGESQTFTIGQPLEDVDDGSLAQLAVSTWKNAIPFKAFCRVVFLFFRFVARTSKDEWYRGQMIPKAGKWFDWWSSTKPFTTSSSIDAAVLQTLEDARHNTIGNRVVWLEQVQVNLFEWKEDIDMKKLTEAPLS